MMGMGWATPNPSPSFTSCLKCDPAAGDVDRLAGHVAREGRREEEDDPSDVVRRPGAPHRNLLEPPVVPFSLAQPHHGLALLAVDLDPHVGVDDARADAVDPDAVF